MEPTTNKTVIPKILVVKKSVAEADWNKHLPTPLMVDEKVITLDDPKTAPGYVRVRHGGEKKAESTFSLHNFLTLTGKSIK